MAAKKKTTEAPKPFKLGPLGNINQVITALGKTLRSMADGSLDSQQGARICNGLGIMRACLETVVLERIEQRLDDLSNTLPGDRSNGHATSDRAAFTSH